MKRLLVILAATVVAAAVVYAAAWAALALPLYLAHRAVVGPPKRRRSAARPVVEAAAALAVGLAGYLAGSRRGPRPVTEEDAYLDGVERGRRSALRSAGHEDGRLAMLDELEGRDFA